MDKHSEAKLAVGHTGLPWAVCGKEPNSYWVKGKTIYSPVTGRRVADTTELDLDAEANAAFIIKACNSHHKLLDALMDAQAVVHNLGDTAQAKIYRDIVEETEAE